MNGEGKPRARPLPRLMLGALLAATICLHGAFVVNMAQWRRAPDLGWTPITELGPRIVGVTTAVGEAAGLRRMDRILELNGRAYATFEELNALTDFAVGRKNVYLVERGGETLAVTVDNAELGLRPVLRQSGMIWLLSFLYFGIGVLVFMMKPWHGPSWAFLTMTSLLSLLITFSAPSFFYRPASLDNVLLFVTPLLPAALVHLAGLFPERRHAIAGRPWLLVLPYALSLALALLARSTATRIVNVPGGLLNAIYLYLLVAVLCFLGAAALSYRRPPSVAVRLQALVIFTGVAIALFVPTVEVLFNLLLGKSFFPDPTLFYLFFLTFLPLSVGYAIVRHDLFEIDVIVRRTYGYILTTAAIVGAYVLVVSIANFAFRSPDIARSPFFSLSFALAVVFLLRPLHQRFQAWVNRVFYRQKYDYRRTIREASEAMISILDPKEIHRTLIGTVVREMFLENGLLLVPEPAGAGWIAGAAAGADAAAPRIPAGAAVLRRLQEERAPIFRHDLDLQPRYESDRQELRGSFGALAAELLLPVTYKSELRGIISLGAKKSGKMFTAEDRDLLGTLVNQSAVALENARLFQENMAKTRMEEELKIAHGIQDSMLPREAPAVRGFRIAARSLSAREVGGDFYDFIERGGDESCRQVAVLVGDVSGKSVSAALMMAAARSIFRVLTETLPTVEEVMNRANRRLHRDMKKGMFVALLYAVIDPVRRVLVFSNAGQTQPILRRHGEGTPEYLAGEGDSFPLGIVPDCLYRETEVTLRPGDTVVLYTDGVVEAVSEAGEMYGFDRLLAAVAACEGTAEAHVENLLREVSRHAGGAEQHDDITVVVVQAQ